MVNLSFWLVAVMTAMIAHAFISILIAMIAAGAKHATGGLKYKHGPNT
ncbi:hypothetical protein [Scardovia inopinata]|nr:hypothetical protein [Scardovia inopinata]BAR06457.1 hypothetical protein SCIP_0390 [Scardovia inopinata JCM 12537]